MALLTVADPTALLLTAMIGRLRQGLTTCSGDDGLSCLMKNELLFGSVGCTLRAEDGGRRALRVVRIYSFCT